MARVQTEPVKSNEFARAVLVSEVKSLTMKCDLCTGDDGKGIHYHAFIEGKHHWVCESCKKKLKIEAEHTDD